MPTTKINNAMVCMATAILVNIPIYLFLNYLYKINEEVPIRNNFIKLYIKIKIK